MAVDPNQVIDDAATLAKEAVADSKGKRFGAFLQSREFLLNAAAVAAHYVGYLPGKYSALVMGALNIVLHYRNGK